MENINHQNHSTLFREMAAGSGAAFSRIFQLYAARLLSKAKMILKSDYWAEEVVQEAFLQVWKGRVAFADIDAPEAYLFRIVANRCFDHLRKNTLDARTEYAVHLLLSAAPQYEEQQHGFDVAALKTLLHAAIAQLPPQQKMVYLLQLEEELSYQEIAERLSISKNTVRNHLAAALRSVRQYLQAHGAGFLFYIIFCECVRCSQAAPLI